jgi:hypothetical protein
MNISSEELSSKFIFLLNYNYFCLSVLKDRLRRICGEPFSSNKGSGNVEESKKIFQQYPQLIDEVRNGF